MTYNTYEVRIEAGDSMKWIKVVACDVPAAHADIREAYGEDVQISCTTLL
jgi:hypothetical protein